MNLNFIIKIVNYNFACHLYNVYTPDFVAELLHFHIGVILYKPVENYVKGMCNKQKLTIKLFN